MRLNADALEDYLGRVGELLERYGVALDLGPDEALVLEESPSGALSFGLRGFLPDGQPPPRSVLELREVWRPTTGDGFERAEYEYELLDHERGFRRAFHRHDTDVFVRRFEVVVHEHCERPIGTASCPHLVGAPIRDGYRGVEVLVGLWVEPTIPACERLQCLE